MYRQKIGLILIILFGWVIFAYGAREVEVTLDAINKLWDRDVVGFLDNADGVMQLKAVTVVNMKTVQRDIDRLANMDDKMSERAWKIATTSVLWYGKIRTVVRYTYEEIKYWQLLTTQFKEVIAYFDEMGKKLKEFQGGAFDFFMNRDTDGNLLEMSYQFAGLLKDVNYLTKVMPKTLDRKLAAMERTYDVMVNDTFSYTINGVLTTTIGTPGVLVGNTAEIFEYLDTTVFGGGDVSSYRRVQEMGWLNRDDISQIEVNLDENELVDDPFRHYTLPIISNQIVASTAMANSLEYRKWAQRAISNLEKVDEQIADILKNVKNSGGVNGQEFAAAWYSVEQVNANNKLLLHSIEEAKIQQAMLGTELHIRSGVRYQQIKMNLDIMELNEN